MSLPTAHNYLIENLIENIFSVEKNFLNPSVLIRDLTKTEKALTEIIESLNKKDFSTKSGAYIVFAIWSSKESTQNWY